MMKKTKADHALTALKAGLSLVPAVGGTLATLVGDYLPTATQRSIERALAILEERLAAIEARIELGSVDRDEFVELFKSCYLVIVRSHREERLRGAANLLANMLLRPDDRDKLSYTALDHFVRCLETLSIGALEVLVTVGVLAGEGSVRSKSTIDFRQLSKRMPCFEPDLLMGLVGELGAANFVHLPGVPEIRTVEYGNYTIEFTGLGRQFLAHVLSQEEGCDA
ncbi:MAG: hypothetical protein KAY24_06975 [Candidatus Eisenbacteria sp.]|nr:hypothetical protein [Candidatus Eisenbacteria bacterium]